MTFPTTTVGASLAKVIGPVLGVTILFCIVEGSWPVNPKEPVLVKTPPLINGATPENVAVPVAVRINIPVNELGATPAKVKAPEFGVTKLFLIKDGS